MSTRRIVWLVVALLAGGCASDRSGTPALPGSPTPIAPRQIVVLGDSLAVSPSSAQGFPARLQVRIDSAALPFRVINAGVFGDTSGDGLRRIDPLLTVDVAVLVLELGANDGLQGVPTSTIETNLGSMIASAQRRNIRVLLCGMETLPSHGFDYALAFHSVFPALAQRFSITLVPFILNGVVFDPALNGADGVHPNAAGAERIAETVWPYLRPLLTAPLG